MLHILETRSFLVIGGADSGYLSKKIYKLQDGAWHDMGELNSSRAVSFAYMRVSLNNQIQSVIAPSGSTTLLSSQVVHGKSDRSRANSIAPLTSTPVSTSIQNSKPKTLMVFHLRSHPITACETN